MPGQRAAVRDRLKARGGVIESEVVGLDAITVKLSPSQFDAMASDQAIATVRQAAWALVAVPALDVETADGILADMELALAMRQQQEPTEPGHTSIAVGLSR